MHLLVLASVSMALVFGACRGGGSEAIDGGIVDIEDAASMPDGSAPDATVPDDSIVGVDILFVIDNSGTMADEQLSLVTNFNRFMNVLNNVEGGLPSVHIGVVSTDLGAGPYGIIGCNGNGDNGVLQNVPSGACNVPGPELYLQDTIAVDGVTRVRNYTGTLEENFSCMAELGNSGCGFEQPLEAMRRALNGSNAENVGFLREDSYLAVVIISDEDDCSVEDISMFDSAAELDTIDSVLGPLSSFRCTEFGIQCTPDTPRSPGSRTNCAPRANSPYLHEVSDYVDFLKLLKTDPSKVIVAGIIGNATPVSVGNIDNEPTLEASCTSASGEADPGIRLKAFLDAFPNQNTNTSICNDDLSDALTVIADLLATVIVSP